MTSETHVRVSFKLEPDDTGYPPTEWERLWAIRQDDGSFLIDNAPFFVRGISLGDRVEAVDRDGELVFKRVSAFSKNTVIRIVVADPYDEEAVMKTLEELGCQGERCSAPRLIALVVPPDIPIEPILGYLDRQYETKRLDFEEAAVRYR